MLGCGLGPENERHSHPAPGKQLYPSECQFSHLKNRKQVKSHTHNWCRIYSKQSAGVSYSVHHAVHEGEASLGYRWGQGGPLSGQNKEGLNLLTI